MRNTTLTHTQHVATRATIRATRALNQACSQGYTRADLARAGYPRTLIDHALAHTTPATHITITGTPPAATTNLVGTDIVSIVAANPNLAAATINDGWYARAHSLTLAVPQVASWLTITNNRHITHLRPIHRRLFIPHPDAPFHPRIHATTQAHVTSITHTPEYRQSWPDATSLFILGDPIALNRPIPLGYAAVTGTRTYRINQLLNAPTLRDATSLNNE